MLAVRVVFPRYPRSRLRPLISTPMSLLSENGSSSSGTEVGSQTSGHNVRHLQQLYPEYAGLLYPVYTCPSCNSYIEPGLILSACLTTEGRTTKSASIYRITNLLNPIHRQAIRIPITVRVCFHSLLQLVRDTLHHHFIICMPSRFRLLVNPIMPERSRIPKVVATCNVTATRSTQANKCYTLNSLL